MKSILIIYALTVYFAYSQGEEQNIPEEFRTRLGKVVNNTERPGKVSRIVAVNYDYTQETSEDVVVEGRLHKGVLHTSKDLTAEQTKKLYSAITGTHFHMKGAMCFMPHHGFIFYDADDKIIGSITICLKCNNYRHAPAGELSKIFDLKGLESLILELNITGANDANESKSLDKESKQGQQDAPPKKS